LKTLVISIQVPVSLVSHKRDTEIEMQTAKAHVHRRARPIPETRSPF